MTNIILKDGQYIFHYEGREYRLSNDYDLGGGEFHFDDDDFIYKNGGLVSIKVDGEMFGLQVVSGSNNRKGGQDNRHRSNDRRGRNSKSNQGRGKNSKGENIAGVATAPYNFIPLPEKLHQTKKFNRSHHIYDADLYHGHIDFDIRTLTPLMIRGDKEAFFKINGIPTIPGSSVRGMVSTMVEVLSGGLFNCFNNRRIYQRAMFPKGASANMYYEEKRPDTKAGFLKFDKRERIFYLRRSEEIQLTVRKIKYNNRPFSIRFFSASNTFEIRSGKMSKLDWRFRTTIKFKDAPDSDIVTIRKEDISQYENDKNRNLGGKDNQINPISIAKQIAKGKSVDKRLDDAFEKYGVPVFYSSLGLDEKGQERFTFGHTKNYRIPYHKTIKEHVSVELTKNDFTDFKKAMFGDEKSAAGKLQFEPLQLKNPGEEAYEMANITKVLGSPNASYYPNYLVQPDGTRTQLPNLKHWGSDGTKIRGYKFYHHINRDDHWVNRKIRLNVFDFTKYLKKKGYNHQKQDQIFSELGIDVRADGNNKDITKPYSNLLEMSQTALYGYTFDANHAAQFTVLRPVKRDQVFSGGRIRFANLSKEELGLLQMALQLSGNARHKIGYAKPYGLGSIQIENVKITLSNRQKRYKTVFSADGQFDEGNETTDRVAEISQASSTALLSFYDCNSIADFWAIKRNQALANMLAWDTERKSSDNWIKQTAYMGLKSFSGKPVLPKINEL